MYPLVVKIYTVYFFKINVNFRSFKCYRLFLINTFIFLLYGVIYKYYIQFYRFNWVVKV